MKQLDDFALDGRKIVHFFKKSTKKLGQDIGSAHEAVPPVKEPSPVINIPNDYLFENQFFLKNLNNY